MLVAAHYVPAHCCLAFVDFERGRFVYTDPHYNSADEQRDCGPTALAQKREHVQLGLERQGPFCDAGSWDLLYLKTPEAARPGGLRRLRFGHD